MEITINDVSRAAGVSKSTISRYLNGRYEGMSDETRERIAGIIAELDYRPNALARSLKQKRTHTVGAIVANILNPFSTSVIRGVEDYCKKSGFNLILCNADDDPQKEKEYLEMLADKQIDGLIINTTGQSNELVASINRKLPVVLIDRKVTEISADTVSVDNIKGVAAGIEHLLRLGHREIAMFTLPCDDVSPRQERIMGYKQALAVGGMAFRPQLLVETEPQEAAVQQKLTALMTGEVKPTAVFAANNLMTIAIIKALRKLKIAIPDGMAVIGFDDWEGAELIEPPVTVIAQPTYDIGVKAAALLLNRIQARKSQKKPYRPSHAVFEPALIIRKSCGEGD
jgi:DNA-binding LacI/PurR family transcriptional regulator